MKKIIFVETVFYMDMIMKRHFYMWTVILAAFALVMAGCKEEIELPQQPASYLELLRLHGEGAVFHSAEYVPGACVLKFVDESEVKVENLDFRVDNCEESEKKAVVKSNGYWKVGTSLTGIAVDDILLPPEKAKPVYVCFDKESLHMYISNEKHLVFDRVPTGPENPDEPGNPDEPVVPEGPTIEQRQNIPVVQIYTDDVTVR